jgi:hypothetical protein
VLLFSRVILASKETIKPSQQVRVAYSQLKPRRPDSEHHNIFRIIEEQSYRKNMSYGDHQDKESLSCEGLKNSGVLSIDPWFSYWKENLHVYHTILQILEGVTEEMSDNKS